MKKTRKRKRRRNHEGSVCERKDGRFQASKMVNGKRIYFYSYDEAECYRWLDELKVKEYHGIPIASGDVTLSEYTHNYIERYAAPFVRPATDKQTRCLIAMIGRFLPVDISPEHVFPIDCSGLKT